MVIISIKTQKQVKSYRLQNVNSQCNNVRPAFMINEEVPVCKYVSTYQNITLKCNKSYFL